MMNFFQNLQVKILGIILIAILLTLLGIGWLVKTYIQQSYEIGVNKRVENALEQGLDYSRQLYQQRKQMLADYLSEITRSYSQKQLADSTILEQLPKSYPWTIIDLQIIDRKSVESADTKGTELLKRHILAVDTSLNQREVFSNRDENRFLAVEKLKQSDVYAVLVAEMADTFLENSSEVLYIYQVFRRFDLSTVSIPQRLLSGFAVIMLGIAGLTFLLTVWLSRRLTKPLKSLIVGTQELGRGNLNFRIEKQSSDELGELVKQFNQMANRLQDYQAETIRLEKMAAWQGIARRLAHEIKNPLTPIQLTIQEIADQCPTDDQSYYELVRDCREIVDEEIANLRNLVKEFSEFGRMPTLQKEWLDVNDIIRELVKLYQHLNIRLTLVDTLPKLYLDEDRIRRALINLIENAAQASTKNDEILISTNHSGSYVHIAIRDHGVGIEPSELENIFQPYFSTKTSGMGLGLAITQKIAEEHQGRIEVASTLNGGSTFTIHISITPSESA